MREARLFMGLFIFAYAMTWAVSGNAATITAKSGSSTDIQAAVNQAKTGDTVAIPAGTFLFTGHVSAPDGIHIKGAGETQTIIEQNDNPTGSINGMFVIDAKTGKTFEFSDMTLQGRLQALQGTNRTTAVTSVVDDGLLIEGAAKNVLIHNNTFTKFIRSGLEFIGSWGTVPGSQTGVVYNNRFIDNWYTYLGYGIAVLGVPSAWNSPLTLGTANALFIEDNYFELDRGCVAANNGANYVARYNTVKNNYQDSQSFDAHGLSSWPAGTHSFEIYKNVVTDSPQRWTGTEIHGGGGVIWGNSWTGVTHGIVLALEDDPPASHPLGSYPALDQIGYQGADVYIWGNTSSSDQVFLYPTSNSKGINYWLKVNRDYFLSAKPGYVPYTYPHPLRATASQ